MTTKTEILDHAIDVLRRGEALTMDSAAREAGLTKPGVVHHFATKETLVFALVDHIVDRWEHDLMALTPEGSSPVEKLRAYVDYSMAGDFDQSDLALLSDVKLRDSLTERWTGRLEPWFGDGIDGTVLQRASLRAARFLADGAWLNNSLGIRVVRDDERDAVHAIAMQLVDDGSAR
jgi:AcrR family transcriptional regulator